MKSISIKYIHNIIIYCIHIHKRFFTMRFKPHVYLDTVFQWDLNNID